MTVENQNIIAIDRAPELDRSVLLVDRGGRELARVYREDDAVELAAACNAYPVVKMALENIRARLQMIVVGENTTVLQEIGRIADGALRAATRTRP